MKLKIQLLLLFFTSTCLHFIYSQNISGTSIIVAWSDSNIVIGADSKLTSKDDTTFSAITCKILVIEDSIVFVSAGTYSDAGFDIQKMAVRILSGAGTFDDKCSRFKDAVTIEFKNILNRKKEISPKEFNQFNTLYNAECAIAMTSKKAPILKMISFSGMIIPESPDGYIVTPSMYSPSDHQFKKSILIPLGQKKISFCFIDSLLNRNTSISPSDFPKVVFSLIALESVANWRTVGGPINIIRLVTGRLPEWIQKHQLCN